MKKTLLLSALVSIMSISNAQVTDGLIRKYSFNNGNATEEINGILNGSVSGAVLTSDRFGNSDKAYQFNGTSDYISLGISADLMPAVGSVSLWMNKKASSSAGKGFDYNPVFIAKNTVTSASYIEGACLYTTISDNKALTITTLSGSSNQKYIFSNAALSNETWYHLVMTYDNTSLKFYVNGVLQNTVSKGFASTFSTTKTAILGYTNDATNTRYFNGKIDDVLIYNKVLSAQEIDNIYAETNPVITSIKDELKSTISFSPNPASSKINFDGFAQLFDLLGNKVAEGTGSINIETLAKGVYVIKIGNATGKMVKE